MKLCGQKLVLAPADFSKYLSYELMALDRVQKRLELPDGAAKSSKRLRLIEGRKPRFWVSSTVAAATERKAEFIKNRAFDDQHYADLVLEFLRSSIRPLERTLTNYCGIS